MPISLTKTTDTCTRCGADCAPFQGRWDIDPLCTACIFDLAARDANLPLPGLHDLAFALGEPADWRDLPEAQGLWRF
jgi:hypothetical protein